MTQNNFNLNFNKENQTKTFKTLEVPSQNVNPFKPATLVNTSNNINIIYSTNITEEPQRKVLKNVGNTKSSEEYIQFLKKRAAFKEQIHEKEKISKNEECLDDSLVQVFPQNKETESTKQYKQLIIANETGLRVEVSDSLINPHKSLKSHNVLVSSISQQDLALRDNPQFVTEYIEDIMHHLRETELLNCPLTEFMRQQFDITPKMRAILIDWLVEVHLKFKLVPETLYLTVNLMDRYLSKEQVQRKNFQLLGAACMLIASKYEEIYAPEVRDFVYITDKAYNRDEIIAMEGKILKALKFDILHVSPYRFLERLSVLQGNDKKIFFLAQFILELSLIEYSMWKYINSVKACASVLLARRILKVQPGWPKVLETASEYSEVSLRSCVKDLCSLLDIACTSSLKGVRNKFASVKFMEVSKLPIFYN